jgi:hypothetical protein
MTLRCRRNSLRELFGESHELDSGRLPLHANVSRPHSVSSHIAAAPRPSYRTVIRYRIHANSCGMDWYIVIKMINGCRYRYRQKTWRENGRVRTRSEYIGPAGDAVSEARVKVGRASRQAPASLLTSATFLKMQKTSRRSTAIKTACKGANQYRRSRLPA